MTVRAAPVGALVAWWPNVEPPPDWVRCRRQPVVEFPCLELIVEVVSPAVLEAAGFLSTPVGWLLPDLPDRIIRVRP